MLWLSDYVVLDGIQVFLDNDTTSGYLYGIRSSAHYTLKISIMRGPDSNTSTSFIAAVYNGDSGVDGIVQTYINNVFYNWNNNSVSTTAIRATQSIIKVIVYNNTFVDNNSPVAAVHTGIYLNNNISQDITSGFSGSFHPSSSHNLSSDTNAPGTGSVISSILTFNNKAGDDFSLAAGDSDAQGSASDLSSDTLYSFDKDILGASKPTADWDMGAFQF